MNIRNYFIILVLAATLVSCKQNSGKNYNRQNSADSPNITDTAQIEMPGDKPVPLSRLIVPGISIGHTAINEASQSVYQKLGKPDKGDAAMGKSVSVWYAGHDTTSYQTQIYFSRDMGNDRTSRVKQIRVASPFFKVSNTLFTGQPVEVAMKQFKLIKVATFTDKGNSYSVYDDPQSGIAFDADDQGVCTGITVHVPGREVTIAYQAFYPDFRVLK